MADDIELPVALTPSAARLLTDQVRDAADNLLDRVLALYEGAAHTALGYTSWGAYWTAEFGQHRSRGYQLLKAARAVGELPQSTTVDSPPNERQMRELVRVPEAKRADVMQAAAQSGRPTASEIRKAARPRRQRRAASPELCPTCGQPMPTRATRIREPSQAEVNPRGWRCPVHPAGNVVPHPKLSARVACDEPGCTFTGSR